MLTLTAENPGELGKTLSHHRGFDAQSCEELGRGIGAAQVEERIEHFPQTGPAVLAGVGDAREDRFGSGGEPQPASRAYSDGTGADGGLDPYCRKRLAVEDIERTASCVEVMTNCLRRRRGGVEEQRQEKVLGADRAIPAPDRFVPSVVVRGAEVVLRAVALVPCLGHALSHKSLDHHSPPPYLAWTDWRVIPSPSAICCHDQP